ncbi:MAG: hypothetical protein NT062_02225, partial [Proteobacteria bacterium]|nr:hypothetical protein [Pseudomonadota bacterium]
MRCALIHGFAGDPRTWDATIAAWRGEVEPFAIAVPTVPWDDALALVADRVRGADLVVGYSLGARLALGLVATGRCARAIPACAPPCR